MLSGCYFSSFSEEKANEAALSYLNDKYGEEFVAKDGGIRTDSIAFGNTWYELTVVKKSEESEEAQRKYTIFITTDRKYTILGDTVMFDYYKPLYEEYVTPIIKNEMNDIPFIITAYFGIDLKFGVEAENNIPVSPDDEQIAKLRGCFEIYIYIPKSYDNDQIPEICKNIKENLTDENYLRGAIATLSEEDFSLLSNSEDKYRAKELNSFSRIKSYKLE